MNLKVFPLSMLVHIGFCCLFFLISSISCNENEKRCKDLQGSNDQCGYQTSQTSREGQPIFFGKEVRDILSSFTHSTLLTSLTISQQIPIS